MSKSIEVKVYDYGTDLYPEYPSRFEAITNNPSPGFSSLPITACGASADEAVNQLLEYYKEELGREEEFRRWKKVKEQQVHVVTKTVEL